MLVSRWFLLSLLVSLAGALPAPALAQDFPNRVVKIVVPYPAGGGVDITARAVAERLSKTWGQPVIIENKPGASTMIGGADVARSTPDGYTLFFTSDQSITSNPHLFKTMIYDPIKGLAPVTQIIDLHQLVVVHSSVPANTLQELVALSKQKPNTLNYASYGVGSQPHLLFEMLRHKHGAQIQQVSYRGIAPSIAAVVAGEVQTTMSTGSDRGGYIAAGRIKPLALSRKEREKSLPQVPTLREAGYPDIDPRSWFGMFAPAGTPPELVGKISKDVAAILHDPAFDARFIRGVGFTGIGSTPVEFTKFVLDDLEYKRNLIAVTGIKGE